MTVQDIYNIHVYMYKENTDIPIYIVLKTGL